MTLGGMKMKVKRFFIVLMKGSVFLVTPENPITLHAIVVDKVFSIYTQNKYMLV